MPGYCIPELGLNMQEKLWGVALGVAAVVTDTSNRLMLHCDKSIVGFTLRGILAVACAGLFSFPTGAEQTSFSCNMPLMSSARL